MPIDKSKYPSNSAAIFDMMRRCIGKTPVLPAIGSGRHWVNNRYFRIDKMLEKLRDMFAPKATLEFDGVKFKIADLAKIEKASPGAAVSHISEKTGMSEHSIRESLQGLSKQMHDRYLGIETDGQK